MIKSKTILLLFTLIFIISCATSGSPKRPGSYIDENYHRGYDGINMEFVEGNPPYRIYAPSGSLIDSYYIILELTNEGSFDVTDNHFIISGYDNNIFDIQESYFQNPPVLEGRSTYNPRGGFETLRWTVQGTHLPTGIDQFQQKFMVSACYDYQTTASIPICVDPNPWEYTSREKICTPDNVPVSGGQGAPVAITHVEVTPMNNRVQMKIEIQNVGDGRVVSNDVPIGNLNSRCPFNLDYNDLNKVELATMPDIGGVRGSCTPDEIILVNNRANFYCTFDGINQNGRDDAYLSTLNIQLAYKYTSSVYRDIEVISVPG